MKFTKGEWHLSEQWWDRIYDDRGRLVTTVEQAIRGARESLANAQLIASAPDLYKALKSVMRMGTVVVSYERSKALEALAKAEGK